MSAADFAVQVMGAVVGAVLFSYMAAFLVDLFRDVWR